MHYLSALAAAQPAEIRERRLAAEQAYGGILSRLGAPGTYDGAPAAAAPGAPEAPAAPLSGKERKQWIRQRTKELRRQGVFKPGTAAKAEALRREETGGFVTSKVMDPAARKIDVRYTKPSELQDVRKIDPESYMVQMEGSAQFRIASRLTAEAEQLVARKGELWNELVNFQQLPIIEAAAMMQRENAENIRRAMARGGAARRDAFAAVQQMRAQERINGEKVRALAAHRIELDQWARDNARTQLEWNQNWAANQAGVRESYNNAMDRASELMVSSALPVMFASKQEAARFRQQAHEQNRNKVMRWVNGVVGVATMGAGIAGGLGMAGPLAAAGANIFGQIMPKQQMDEITEAGKRHAGGLVGAGAGILGLIKPQTGV
jgi:hypothetical protein